MDTASEIPAHRSYLGVASMALLSCLACVVLFNLWVDPYRLFRIFPDTSLTSVKSRPDSNIGAIKLLNAVAARPECVIIGNSRADIGFSPQHPGWRSCAGHVYNLAVPGAGIDTVRDDFRALVQHSDVKVALLAVDFQDFVLNSDPVGTPSRHPKVAPERLLRDERIHALVTMTGLSDSLATLSASHQTYPATLNADGQNPLRDYIAIAAREGYPSMFRQRLNETTANYVRARIGIFPPGATDSAEFEGLRDILMTAQDHGVQLHVVTYPYHSQYYLMFQRVDTWPAFEAWKRQLVRTITASNAAQPYKAQARLWDFSVVSEPSVLAVENTTAHGAAKWYWEAGHFKQTLGDRVLDQVLGRRDGTQPPIGAELTTGNVESWIQAQETALGRYAKSSPDQLAEVEAVVANARLGAAGRPK